MTDQQQERFKRARDIIHTAISRLSHGTSKQPQEMAERALDQLTDLIAELGVPHQKIVLVDLQKNHGNKDLVFPDWRITQTSYVGGALLAVTLERV